MKSIHITLTSLLSVILIVSALCLLPLSPLKAENHDPSPPQKELIGPNLEPFAGAYKEVYQIHTAYKQRIIQAKDPAQTDALQQEANQKMNQAVADHGLTIADYNKIFQSIQNDPELKEEFMTVLNRTR